MPSVHDVAKYLLEEHGPMESMKLQKLVFYANAYSCAWESQVMFPETVEAWKHGPVVRELFNQHQGQVLVHADDLPMGKSAALDEVDKEIVESVWDALGNLSGYQLRTRTHQESPWIDAYVESDRYHRRPISFSAMRDYYRHN